MQLYVENERNMHSGNKNKEKTYNYDQESLLWLYR